MTERHEKSIIIFFLIGMMGCAIVGFFGGREYEKTEQRFKALTTKTTNNG